MRFDEKNDSYWSYVMKKFLKSKKMWDYIIDILSKPMNENDEEYKKKLNVWEVSNSKIII